MKNTIKSTVLIFALAISSITFGQDKKANNIDNSNIALAGYSPVSYLDLGLAQIGNKAYKSEYNKVAYYFTSEEQKKTFDKNPERYLPQYGGYCAFAVSHNFTKSVKPDVWEIVDGKLYLNFNRTAYRKWKKDVDGSIERGDANWPTVLSSCEEHGNCRKPI